VRTETFTTPGAVRLSVAIASGRVEIEARPGATETLVELEALQGDSSHEADARIELRRRGDHAEVSVVTPRGGRISGREEYRVSITTPAGAAVDVSSASADVEARGTFSAFEVQTSSGDVEAEEITGRLKARTASGDLVFGRVEGDASVNSASGDVQLASLFGRGTLRSASGDVVVGEAAADLSISTASGGQTITSVATGEVTLRSASGDVHVGIRRGSRVHVDARSGSGELESELELGGEQPAGDGPLVELSATTASGDVRIVRA
jgi:DUF4097 and DUF4098 domain-containing protein YvlB